MNKTDDTAYLIRQIRRKNEFGAFVSSETKREIYVQVKSVKRADYYKAAQGGFAPEYVLVTALCDYDGEAEVEYAGERYRVFRAYHPTDSDEIELHIAKKAGTGRADETN